MKKLIIKLGIGGMLVGLIAVLLVFRFVINKPHPDYEKIEPAFVLLAADLFESYAGDRSTAEELYNGKIVQLNGTLTKIEKTDSLTVGIFVFDEGMFGDEGVRCTMLPQYAQVPGDFAEGSEVRIKGFVAGYNETDVILDKCSIIK